MKKKTKLLCALLCGVLLCGAVAVATPKEDADVTPAPRQVSVEIVQNGKDPTTTETMKKGETIQLVVKQDTASSEEQTAGSGSGNPSEPESDWEIEEGQGVIELDGKTGVVKAKEAGEATVIKRVEGGVAACKIIVEDKTVVEKLTIEGSQEMRVGETQKLQLSITPTEAREDANIKWESDKPDILSVDETGTVTAHAIGSATITAAANNVTAKLTISVVSDVQSLTIKPDSMKMIVGSSIAVQVTPTPADANIEGARWDSSDPAVAYYKDGRIYGVKVGSARITVSVGEVTASCAVTVKEKNVQPNPQPSTQPNKPNNKPNTNPSSKPNTGNTSGSSTTKPITGVGSQFTYVPNTGSTFLYMPGSTVTVTEFAYTMPKNIPEAVYLTIDSKMDAMAGSIADTLSANGMQATFFVSTDNLYGADDMLRHVTGDGNSIGLLLTPEQANSGSAVALLDQANQQLSVITGMPTRLVRISGGTSGNVSSETVNKLLDAGYRVWDWNTDARESSQAADASYQAVSKAIDTTGTPTVRFDGTVATDTVLRQLLPYMKYCSIPTRAIQASDSAVCNTAVG